MKTYKKQWRPSERHFKKEKRGISADPLPDLMSFTVFTPVKDALSTMNGLTSTDYAECILFYGTGF